MPFDALGFCERRWSSENEIVSESTQRTAERVTAVGWCIISIKIERCSLEAQSLEFIRETHSGETLWKRGSFWYF